MAAAKGLVVGRNKVNVIKR